MARVRMCEAVRLSGYVLLLLLPLLAGTGGEGAQASSAPAAWPVCDSRAERDAEIEPGGLRLLGVKESPLGAFPRGAAAATQEHLIQQLRDVMEDNCPRIAVHIGLQPAAGPLSNWTLPALWLQYFSHGGAVVVVDAVDDYLRRAESDLRTLLGDLRASDRVEVTAVQAAIAAETRARATLRPVTFDMPGGGRALASDEVIRRCSDEAREPRARAPGHVCAEILARVEGQAEPLEYLAQVRSFDDVWRRELQGRHLDFLRVDLGLHDMSDVLRRGFSELLARREVSILSIRIDEHWTKATLKAAVEWLDRYEYFSMFVLLCSASSQRGTFAYRGPGASADVGPTTYLPLSGIDLEAAIAWDQLKLPQDLVAFDLRQPDLFRAVQLGDEQCDVDEAADDEGACAADGSGGEACAAGEKAPGAPQHLRAIRATSRSLTLEWQASAEGARTESYSLRIDPGAQESALDHDARDGPSGMQVHTITGLKPNVEYTVRLQALDRHGAASEEVLVRHRTEREEAAAAGSAYEIVEGLHCGMGAAEEVRPAGPPPEGRSFFRDTTDVDSCQARCDDSRACVAFQVRIGEACWLYQQKPRHARFAGPAVDAGWACGARRSER
eukprot:TRINITY_DN22711_c0_g1_i1.p1 TRINITY_DN22711_c0_g1~~TRINITY_DN22711_c0_g1_i1.p1  ORF type:complete len:661 (-),score=133.11 TRINITY_DN22711_c0_g1_i1:126-1964(-)